MDISDLHYIHFEYGHKIDEHFFMFKIPGQVFKSLNIFAQF